MQQKVQRLACLGITGAMRPCSTAAMDVLFNIPSLYLQIRKEATLDAIKLHLIKDYNSDDMIEDL